MAESNEQSRSLSPVEVQESQTQELEVDTQDTNPELVRVKSPGECSWEVLDISQEDASEVEPDTKNVAPDPVVHQHVHRHINVRKTVLKDCGNHFHVNRSRRVFVTHVHHHHYLIIKHIHVYGNTGAELFEFSSSSSDAPTSDSRSSSLEPRSASSDSQ